MIWGKVLHPGESLTETVDCEIHLSMASLECRPRITPRKDLTAHVVLKTSSGEYLLCSLGYGPTPQQCLDLVLQPQEQITFIVEGSGVVYLTGYTIPQSEPVSYYGDDDGFDDVVEDGVEDGGVFSQQEEGSHPDWEIASSEETDITVKTEEELQNTVHAVTMEDAHPAPMEAIHDHISYENGPTESSDRLELSSHGDEIAVAQIDDDEEEREEESFTNVKWTLNESTAASHQQSRKSQQSLQKCVTCPNLIPFKGPLEGGNGGQSSENVVVHCQSCLQILQANRKKHQTMTQSYVDQHQRPTVLSHVDKGNNRRKHQSWNTSYSVPQNIHTARVCGNDQQGGQRWTNQDRLCSYYCSYCNKGFSSTAGLKVHERMHTGEKPYKCRFCHKAFTQCTNWKSHEKTHTGEKPHKCSYCEKTFIRSDAVKSHERTHTGEKPYQCQSCPRAFGQRAMLKKHELLHQAHKQGSK